MSVPSMISSSLTFDFKMTASPRQSTSRRNCAYQSGETESGWTEMHDRGNCGACAREPPRRTFSPRKLRIASCLPPFSMLTLIGK